MAALMAVATARSTNGQQQQRHSRRAAHTHAMQLEGAAALEVGASARATAIAPKVPSCSSSTSGTFSAFETGSEREHRARGERNYYEDDR